MQSAGVRSVNTSLTNASRALGQQDAFAGARAQFGLLDAAKTGLDIAQFGKGFVGTTANSLAASVAPSVFGTGAPAAGVIGPTQLGSATAAGFGVGAALSGAGIGYAVGTFNPLVQKQAGGQIGGTIGGAIGSIWGPIGTVVGSFLGSTIGGLFGPGRAHPAATFGTLVDDKGDFTTLGYMSKHTDTAYAQAVAGEAQAFSKGLGELGYGFNQVGFHGGVDDGKGLAILSTSTNARDKVINFDANDARAASNAFAQVVLSGVALDKAPQALRDAVAGLNTTGKTAQEILTELKGKVGAPGGLTPEGKAAILPDPAARDNVTSLTATKQLQLDTFIAKVKAGQTGVKATIATGPQGDLSAVTGKRKRLVSLLKEDDSNNGLTPLLKAA